MRGKYVVLASNGQTVTMAPVGHHETADKIPDENRALFEDGVTPGGEFTLPMLRSENAGQLPVGREVFIDITPVD